MDQINDDPTKLYFYENRLLTFDGWPFQEDCVCTPENMAKAGFIHVPSENCPDLAQCFFCLKELEGWEPDDDPEKEHKAHSSSCNFITLKKPVESLTVEEFLRLQKERQKCIIKNMCGQAIEKFEEAVKLKRGQIIQSAMGEE
ncbi:baculoviral IAP repeat-containing protein 5a [Tachysurus fulvidraco]|uniref:baculoviral IAP repeat-containing protein 5a n=1 Tax=Tachysurus fulvidraco TaxID=1234273 RepID=UPI000F4F6CA7|nr:baculoviral IAP repeat-containing protein 5a [Tachysurus fulvidraco]